MEVTPELLKILARRKKMEEDRELEEKIKRNNVSTRPKTKRKSIGSQVQSICQMFETGEGLNPKQDDDGLNPKQDINGLNQNQEPKTPVATIPSPIFPPPIKLSTEPCNSFLYKCRIQNTTVDVPDEYYDIPKTPVPCIVEPRINGSFNSVFRDLDRSSTMSSKQSSNSSSTTSSAKGSFLWNHINKNNNKDRISQLSDSSGIVDCLSISSADDVNNNANNNETEALYESIERLNIYESCDDVRAKEGEDVYECVSDKESDEFGTCVDPSGTVEVSAVNNGWFNKAIEETATSNSDKYSR